MEQISAPQTNTHNYEIRLESYVVVIGAAASASMTNNFVPMVFGMPMPNFGVPIVIYGTNTIGMHINTE